METGDEQFWVFCRKGGFGPDSAIAIGDEVEVYFGEVLQKSNQDIAETPPSRYAAMLTTGAKPELDAAVTACSS